MPSICTELQGGFQLGPWTVTPDRGLLQNGEDSIHLEPMVMDVLMTLASKHGEVVSKDELVDKVWRGRSTSDDAIAAKIAALRNRLGDNSKHPEYIETVQKRGYRLKASVDLQVPASHSQPAETTTRRFRIPLLIALVIVALGIAAFWPDSERIDSIAVVPFKNLSDDNATYQYVVDGFTEELVVSLGRIPDIRITRGTSTDDPSLQKMAKTLNVDAIVSGSLRTDGDKLRVTIVMTSANGFQRWANSIDGASKDVFGIQERVANHVFDEVLGESEPDIQRASRPSNFEAYDNYMRGLFFLAKRDLPSLQAANDLFAETISLDPAFGPAYFRQAVTQLLLADYIPARMREIHDAALEIARRGAQRDNNIRDPIQLIHAYVHHQRGNWAEASNAFDIAFRGGRSFPAIDHWYSRYLGDLGLLHRSLEYAAAARAMDPASQVLNSRLAIAYMWADDMANAGRYFDIANAMGVGVPDHHLGHAVFLLRNERFEEAGAAVSTAFALAQVPANWVEPVFDSLADPGNVELHDHAIAMFSESVGQGLVSPYVALAVWQFLGETERAMQHALQAAAVDGVIYELELVFVREFAEFRRHPGFLDLLGSLGVTRHWANIGCLWRGDELVCDGD